MRKTLVNELREDDLMTLRWNADVNTVYQKTTGTYRILNNKGEYIGEIIRECGNNCRIVFYENEMTKEKIQKLLEIKEVATKISNNQLQNPNNQIKKVIPFSRHIDSYQKYNYFSRYAA